MYICVHILQNLKHPTGTNFIMHLLKLEKQNHILHHILNKSTNIDNNIVNTIY